MEDDSYSHITVLQKISQYVLEMLLQSLTSKNRDATAPTHHKVFTNKFNYKGRS